MDKKGSIKGLMYGMVFFTLIIMGGIAMLNAFDSPGGGFISNDSSNSVANFSHLFNKNDTLHTNIGGIQTNIEGAQPNADTGFGAYGFLDNLIQVSYNTMKSFFSTFSFVTDIFKGLEDMFGVPSYIVGLLGLLVTILIAFQIFGAIFQRDI